MNTVNLTGKLDQRGLHENPIILIKECFEKLKAGESMLITAPHRNMSDEGRMGEFYFFPDRFETPKTFSLKQIVQDALVQICPEAHKDVEEVNWNDVHPDSKVDDDFPVGLNGIPNDGQGFWKFLDLKIEDGYIHAIIKKI